MSFAEIGLFSHAAAAVAFLALLTLAALSWRRGAVGAWLVFACGATALWAVAAGYDFATGRGPTTTVSVLEVLRTGGWLGFLFAIMFRMRASTGFGAGWKVAAGAVALVSLAVIGLEIAGAAAMRPLLPPGMPAPAVIGRLVLSVAGLLLVENLLRNAGPEHRWGIKFLCFGIGGLFAYDFFLFADALLFNRISGDLFAARGVTNALIVPLIAISARRTPDWSIDVFVSRQVIFHSATLIGAGGYLLVMAAAGFYLREFGGEWGVVVEAVFLFTAAIFLVVIIFSGSARARLKDAISRNFFSYKYDYRDEWLRFISTISSTKDGVGLGQRIIEGISNIVESPQGALWTRGDGDRFALLESWNLAAPEGDRTVDPSFTRFLGERQTVINLQALHADPGLYDGLVVPDWLSAERRAWLVVPLLHHDDLLGFLLLCQPRAPREVDREDYVLLTTVGRQAASYLAERASASALAEARQFDEFNKRFAFVLHDIKNLVSQLSLLVQNADRHRNNPAFQEDMVQTVKESVVKMNGLLVRLHESGREAAATSVVELAPLLTKTINRHARGDGVVRFESEVDGIAVVANAERLGAVIAHLVDNALEAVGAGGAVTVRLNARGGDAVIEVADDGNGMDEDFIRNELFRPFRTTKPGGFGIGAYESREFVRELGGRLDVESTPGVGTVMRISLPAMLAGAGAAERSYGAEAS